MDSSVAICCLWTKKEPIAQALAPSKYCVLGNLYSKDGINYLLRNVLAYPRIRKILLVGRDNTKSGEALVRLFEYGLGRDHRIIKDGTLIHAEIPDEAVNLVRENVKLIDNRNTVNREHIADIIETIRPTDSPFADAPQLFPYIVPQPEILPAETTGFVVRGRLVAEVWLKLVSLVMQFGKIDKTQHSVEQKELLDVVAVITDEDPLDIYCPRYLPCSKLSLEGKQSKKGVEQLPLPGMDVRPLSYYDSILSGTTLPDLSYTYGERLRNYGGVDQIGKMITELRNTRYSRRAVAVLWDPRQDPLSLNPPCLDLVQARIRDGHLFLTVYFRSHDIFRAWPENAFAMRKLQEYIATGVENVELGDLILVSHSAHIYEDCWENTLRILDSEYSRDVKHIQRDPRGNFAIHLEDGEIVVEHYGPDGAHLGTYYGRRARVLERQIAHLISVNEHALYVGRELAKAEIALRAGIGYKQDQHLSLQRVKL